METKIGDILKNYSITAPERVVCKTVCEVLEELLDVSIHIDSVRYQNGTVWVDTTPLIRSYIHLHKTKIQEELSTRIENRNISEIH